jgi:putative ABC transport system permease protein
MINTILRLAFTSLLRNRLRATLTVLGIAIGIAAVICTAALGAAGSSRVQEQIDALGEDFLWIRAGSRNLGGTRTGAGGARSLKPEDGAALVALVPEIVACSPQVSGREQVIAGGQNWNTRYQGVLPSFFEIRRRTLAAGTWFSSADVAKRARVLVLGLTVSERLFGDQNPVGRNIRMGRFVFQVIGVLTTRGVARGGVDRDDVVFVPLTTARTSLDRRDWVSDIMCAVESPGAMDRAEAQTVSVLRARHKLLDSDPDDFQIQKPIESLQMRAQAARTMTFMLTAIGAVSLIVGGVGIMNIMLVSVTERKREIGVRLAIGARVRDIRRQFLLEAAALGVVGGLFGIGLGWTAATVLSNGFGWPTVVTTDAVTVAAVSAISAGVLFGYYPARRASNLDPIEAIRLDD